MSHLSSGKPPHIGTKVVGSRVDIGSQSLFELICAAYEIKPYQLSGPDWMLRSRFGIDAKIPEGVSKDMVPAMLQSLLAERFKLTVHRESKDHSAYALLLGRGGLKFKESAPETNPPPPPGGRQSRA